MSKLPKDISLHKFNQFDSTPKSEKPGERSWLLSYLDLMTLLLVLFVALISKATLDPHPARPGSDSIGGSDGGYGAVDPFEQQMLEKLTEGGSQNSLLDGLESYFSGSHLVDIKRSEDAFILSLSNSLLFQPGEARLEPRGSKFLKNISFALKQLSGNIQIEGHADSDSIQSVKFPSNWELSSTRAATVARALQGMGVSKERLSAIGYSDSRPIGPNTTEAGKKKNRRVVINIKIQ